MRLEVPASVLPQPNPQQEPVFGALHLPGFDMDKMLTTGRVPPHSIQLAIAEHGALRVFGAAAMAMMRALLAPAEADPTAQLSDHLRRDIGLPPRGSPLPEAPMLPVRW